MTTALESTLDRIRNAAQALGNEETLGQEPAGPNSHTALFHALVSRIDHGIDHLRLHIKIAALLDHYGPEQKIDPERDGERCDSIDDVIVFERPFNGPVNGRPARLLLGHVPDRPRRDAALIALVANARRWSGMLLSGKATSVLEITECEGHGKGVISRTLPLAFLAPDIAEAILDGRQPDGLTAGGLYRLADLPRDWDAQRRLLGFSRAT